MRVSTYLCFQATKAIKPNITVQNHLKCSSTPHISCNHKHNGKAKAWALSIHKSSPLPSFAMALSAKRSHDKPRHHTELNLGYKLSLRVSTYLCFQATKASKPNITVQNHLKCSSNPHISHNHKHKGQTKSQCSIQQLRAAPCHLLP